MERVRVTNSDLSSISGESCEDIKEKDNDGVLHTGS